MPDFELLYLTLFRAVTDSVDLLDLERADLARKQLIRAQQLTEEMYIQQDEEGWLARRCKKTITDG